MKKSIFITKPFLPPKEEYLNYINEIWDSGQVTNKGPFHKKFEKYLADYLGVKYLSLLNNGTIALICAQKALGFKGEIITTPFSFIATTQSILWNNCKPVFVDTDSNFGNLSPTQVENAINDKTGGILAVNNYGIPYKNKDLISISNRYKIPLIFDSASSIGVELKGKSILTMGDANIISFHGTKVFSTFEGGAVISNKKDIKEKIDHIKNFSIDHEEMVSGVGINGKMNEMEASMGILQLKYLKQNIKKRKEIFDYYHNEISLIDNLKMISIPKDVKYNYSYAPIFFNDGLQKRDYVYQKMRENNIFPRKYWYPLISKFDNYNFKGSNSTKNAIDLSERVLCLPIYPDLSMADCRRIIRILKD